MISWPLECQGLAILLVNLLFRNMLAVATNIASICLYVLRSALNNA
jgi:hypothetical protein